MKEIDPGAWTIEVSEFEPSTFVIELEPGGSVSGERHANGYCGIVSGTWSSEAGILWLNLVCQPGLHPQPVNYAIRLNDACHGSDDAGHRFTLRKR